MRPLALAYHGDRHDGRVREDPHGLFVSWARLRRHVAWLRRRGLLAGDVRRAGRARGGRAVRADVRRRVRRAARRWRTSASRRPCSSSRAGSAAGIPTLPTPRCCYRGRRAAAARGGRRDRGHTATHPDLTTLGFDAARDELDLRAALALEALLERAGHLHRVSLRPRDGGDRAARAPRRASAPPAGRAASARARRRSTTRARTWTARRRCSGCGSRRRGATSRSCARARRGACGGRAGGEAPHEAVVLVHHGVGAVSDAEDPDRLVVSPAHLESQVRLLLRLGYRFATAERADRARAGARAPRC